MIELKPTDILTADKLAPYVRQISPGDLPYPFVLRDETGRAINSEGDYFAGGYLILVFVPDLENEAAKKELHGYCQRARTFDDLKASVLVITATSDAAANKTAKLSLNLPFSIAGDADGSIFAAYGLHKRGTAISPTDVRSVILTPYRQIRSFWDSNMVSDHAQKAEELIRQAKLAEETQWLAPHPPVLIVPKVLDREECSNLIRLFETKGPLRIDKRKQDEAPADYKMPSYEYGRQDRIDHVIADQQTIQFLDHRLHARVIPMIKQAFGFEVTKREALHIARYSGERGGNQIGHRDNVSASFHRRFALSLNLNDDYEGGEVVFGEYGPRGYRNPAGSALVFSSSLLHEVLETTKGVRYTLISHFFNESMLPNGGKS